MAVQDSIGATIERLTLSSVRTSTHRKYSPLLLKLIEFRRSRDQPDFISGTYNERVRGMLEFLAAGYLKVFGEWKPETAIQALTAITTGHRIHAGIDLPSTDFRIRMVKAGMRKEFGDMCAEKGISSVEPLRRPLRLEMIDEGSKQSRFQSTAKGRLMICLLECTFAFMARASELTAANARGEVHPLYCLRRSNISFTRKEKMLEWEDRKSADTAIISFHAHKGDMHRIGSRIAHQGRGLELTHKLLDMFPNFNQNSPLAQYTDDSGHTKIIQSRELAAWLRAMLTELGVEHPEQYSGHSGRIGGATQLWEKGATMEMIMQAGRWKSDAFMKYIRNTIASAIRVSNTLMTARR
jgi:hypothetical protein